MPAIRRIVEAELRHADCKLLGVVDELLVDLHSGRIEYLPAAGLPGQRLQFPWSSITVEHGNFVLRALEPHLVPNRARGER